MARRQPRQSAAVGAVVRADSPRRRQAIVEEFFHQLFPTPPLKLVNGITVCATVLAA
jgi:hypothetical protein